MIFVEITHTKGSAPRDAGTVMAVCETQIIGTIGGGALEYTAIAKARDMLKRGTLAHHQTLPLGPGLGQCCGGSVTLRYGRAPRITGMSQVTPELAMSNTSARPLWIWGAGHVGRAFVNKALKTNAFEITWVDTSLDRFPVGISQEITRIPTPDMPRLAAHAPPHAHHLILTYSHDIDLALCAALLRRRFAYCGLIGSATKWARFGKRLRDMGLEPSAITCPIGDKALGKHPDHIAYSTLKALLADVQLEVSL